MIKKNTQRDILDLCGARRRGGGCAPVNEGDIKLPPAYEIAELLKTSSNNQYGNMKNPWI